MQLKLLLKREGFNEQLKLGDVVVYDNKSYILTHIMSIKKGAFTNSSLMIAEVLVQSADYTRSEYYDYDSVQHLISKKDNDIYIGKILRDHDVYGEVISIEAVEYEFVDMVIKFTVKLIEPWSQEKIDEAFRKYRLSTFTVLKRGNTNE